MTSGSSSTARITGGRSVRSATPAPKSATPHSDVIGLSRTGWAGRVRIAPVTSVATDTAGARAAVAHYEWREAFDLFAAADAVSPLDPDCLDQMAECAWWIGRMRHCIALRERAHTAYLKLGDVTRAGAVATSIAEHYGDLGELADAEAWI